MSTEIEPYVKPYVSPLGARLSEFPMEFGDEVKPAYLLTDVEKLLNREVNSTELERTGLVRNRSFLVKNASDIPDGVQDMNVLGAANGKRTVVSLDGLIKLILSDRYVYDNKVNEWVTNIVVPKALRAYPKYNDDPALVMLRRDVDRMGREIRQKAPELGLEEASFASSHKKEIIIGVVVVAAIVTAVTVYIVKRRKRKQRELLRLKQ